MLTTKLLCNLYMCDADWEISGIYAYISEATAGSTLKQHSSRCLKPVKLELMMCNAVDDRKEGQKEMST